MDLVPLQTEIPVVSQVFSIPLDLPARRSSASGQHRYLASRYWGDEQARLVRVAADQCRRAVAGYNPLVLTGPTGTGKSALAAALTRLWSATRPDHHPLTVSGREFSRVFAAAVEADAVDDLRRRYRTAPLLVIDDVQQLGGKWAAQAELVRTIDVLLATRHQVIATLRPLSTPAATLLPALQSRLAGGLTIPLQAPGPLARRHLLADLAARRSLNLPAEVLDVLARSLAGTASQLDDAVGRFASFVEPKQLPMDATLVERFIAKRWSATRPSLRTIASRVARYCQVPAEQLRGPSRRRAVARARGLAIYFARRLTRMSLEKIGRYFGQRDHTTVLHAYRKTCRLLEVDDELRHVMEEIGKSFDTCYAMADRPAV